MNDRIIEFFGEFTVIQEQHDNCRNARREYIKQREQYRHTDISCVCIEYTDEYDGLHKQIGNGNIPDGQPKEINDQTCDCKNQPEVFRIETAFLKYIAVKLLAGYVKCAEWYK